MNIDNLPPLTPADERTLAFARVLDLAEGNAALIQAVAAYGAAVRADERERCAAIAESTIPSGFTGAGKLGNSFAVARDDRARQIAYMIRHGAQK